MFQDFCGAQIDDSKLCGSFIITLDLLRNPFEDSVQSFLSEEHGTSGVDSFHSEQLFAAGRRLKKWRGKIDYPGMFSGNSERRACGCATCSWRPVSGQAHNRFFNEEKRDWGEPIISKLLGRSSL